MSGAPTLTDALSRFRDAPERSAILLDVDGTLAPIVRHADDAHVPETTRAPLIAIARAYGLTACVSGRRAAAARRIVSLGSITYVGNHGAEILRGGSTDVEILPEWASAGEAVSAFAEQVWTDGSLHRLRVRAEDKEQIAAFHWRGAPDEAAAEEAMRAVAARADAAGFITHWGRKVLEVRPGVHVDKGQGIARLLQEFDGIDVALYAGDDVTDLDAFRGLRELVADGTLQEALCVGVTSNETPPELEREADLLVDGPDGVRKLLGALL